MPGGAAGVVGDGGNGGRNDGGGYATGGIAGTDGIPGTDGAVGTTGTAGGGDNYVTPPTVTTVQVGNPSPYTGKATCIGIITRNGGSDINERGICWSETSPVTCDPSMTNKTTGAYALNTEFTFEMSELSYATTYYVRAYAKNANGGVGYGTDKTFRTASIAPIVSTTSPVTNMSYHTATVEGNVKDNGGEDVTARGVCWSTVNQSPTWNDNDGCQDSTYTGVEIGKFTVELTAEAGLKAGSTYYVRAYAKNKIGIGYADKDTNQVEFTTTDTTKPTTQTEMPDHTATTATFKGMLTDYGGATVTKHGFLWSKGSEAPTEDNHMGRADFTEPIENGASFEHKATGFTPTTTYTVIAYAENEKGKSYGSKETFTTDSTKATVVVTVSPDTITEKSATFNGEITNNGGSIVTEKGFCKSETASPDWALLLGTPDCKSVAVADSFTADVTGLTGNTTYYVAAYAKNENGHSFGNTSFQTKVAPTKPKVTTYEKENWTKTSTTLTGGGSITDFGNAKNLEKRRLL